MGGPLSKAIVFRGGCSSPFLWILAEVLAHSPETMCEEHFRVQHLSQIVRMIEALTL